VITRHPAIVRSSALVETVTLVDKRGENVSIGPNQGGIAETGIEPNHLKKTEYA
jgi:hypothetical protein